MQNYHALSLSGRARYAWLLGTNLRNSRATSPRCGGNIRMSTNDLAAFPVDRFQCFQLLKLGNHIIFFVLGRNIPTIVSHGACVQLYLLLVRCRSAVYCPRVTSGEVKCGVQPSPGRHRVARGRCLNLPGPRNSARHSRFEAPVALWQ